MESSIIKNILGEIDKVPYYILEFLGINSTSVKRYERSVHLNHHGFDLRHLQIIQEGRELVLEGLIPASEGKGLKCFKEFYVVGKKFRIEPKDIKYTEEQLVIPITVYS